MPQRRALIALSLGLAAACTAPAAFAQAKPLRIIVSFSPGGPVDFVARALGEQLGKELGQSVVIENKAGANGAIGAAEVMRSPPDGSTLWITSVGAAAINPALYDKLPYDMQRDFTPVSLVVNNVELLVVNPKNPASTAAELVAASKKGEPVSMASSGIGSIPHLAIEQLMDATGAKMIHVPYKGAAPAITDVLGGQVGGFFGDIPGLIGYVRSGKLKPLGLASAKRHPALPEVKTLAEQGIPGVDTNNWYAPVRAGEDAGGDRRAAQPGGAQGAGRAGAARPAARHRRRAGAVVAAGARRAGAPRHRQVDQAGARQEHHRRLT